MSQRWFQCWQVWGSQPLAWMDSSFNHSLGSRYDGWVSDKVRTASLESPLPLSLGLSQTYGRFLPLHQVAARVTTEQIGLNPTSHLLRGSTSNLRSCSAQITPVQHYSICLKKNGMLYLYFKNISLISLAKWIPIWVIVEGPLGLGELPSWIKYFECPPVLENPVLSHAPPLHKSLTFSNLNDCPSEAKSLFWVYSCYFLNFLNTYMWIFFLCFFSVK